MHRAIIVSLTFLLPSAGFAEEPKDPFQWLEDVAGEKSLHWVKKLNAVSTGELTKNPEFKALEERLLKILDSKDRIPMISKNGAWFYNFWRDDKNKRGLWRRTTLEEYRKDKPNWEVVLDLDELCAKEKENWVWHGANFLQPKYERCLISLSRGGADADVTREFDMTTKSFVKDGFLVPEAKSQVSWKNLDTLYVATDFGPNTLTKSGYPRITKEWKRGTPFEKATLVYEGKPDDMRAVAAWDLTPGFEREYASRRIGFYSGETFFKREGKWVKVDVPDDARVSWHRKRLFVVPRTDWKVGEKMFVGGSLIATNFEDFMDGTLGFTVLFEPTERTSLAGFTPTKTRVVVNALDNVVNKFEMLTDQGQFWTRNGEIPGAAPMSSANITAVDPDETDEYFLTGSNYLNPSSLYYGTLGGKPAEKLKSGPSFFDAKGLEVTQHEVASKDGTKIPYFQVSRKDMKLDGTNPTLLYGYGGFEISMLPGYNPATGAAWLEKGGVYVVANIRGGGEFGPKWHQAALKEKRNRCYEDFAAVAEDLVKRKITEPKHLGTMGGSNGGLLMGNMLTQYPDKFGAIVCQVPLLDMQRYHKLLAGASWMAEYGNPDTKDWEFMKSFSAYQNVSAGTKYPRTLFTTSTRDDRVHPGHARKMAAKMIEQGHDVLLYENIEGGHGGAADNKQAAFMQALSYSFLWKQVK